MSTEHLEYGAGKPVPRERTGRTGRQIGLIVGLVGAGALIGGGVWAWHAWFSQGPQPSEALPADTLAYVSIDLDPSGEQKIEAIKFLKKFPAFENEIGLDTDDDVRKEIFETIQGEGACEDLDYGQDVEPWLGDRAALAVVDLGNDHPHPVFVLQTKDKDKAEKGLEELVSCGTAGADGSSSSSSDGFEGDVEAEGHEELGGYAFNGDWVVVAETEDIAKDVVEKAKDSTLADDSDYDKWTEAAGDPGIITMYAAPEAGKAFVEFLGDFPFLFGLGLSGEDYAYGEGSSVEPPVMPEPPDSGAPSASAAPSATPGVSEPPEASATSEASQTAEPVEPDSESPASQPTVAPAAYVADECGNGEIPDGLRQAFEDFPGGAGTVRFNDGDLEIEFASGTVPGSMTSVFAGGNGADVLSTLPDTTAAALGGGFEDGWVDDLVDEIAPLVEMDCQTTVEEAVAEFEEETGLSVPEDVEALGGESFAISFDAEFDSSAFDDEDITRVPVGAKIKGDPAAIEAALHKLRAKAGSDGDLLLSRTEDGYVLVSGSEDYLDKMADGGDLGDSSTFKDLVPNADQASAIMFVNFDAGEGWLDKMMSDFADDEFAQNLEPLHAIGLSSWLDGEEAHSLVRVTTD